jgi:hypothetical protein
MPRISSDEPSREHERRPTTPVNDYEAIRTDREHIDRVIADAYRAVEESREMRARQRVEAEEAHRRMAHALEQLAPSWRLTLSLARRG